MFTRRLSFAAADVDPITVDYLAEMIAATRIEVVADFYPSIINHDKLAALPVLETVPVLVLCGDHDLLTPLAHSEQIAAALPDAAAGRGARIRARAGARAARGRDRGADRTHRGRRRDWHRAARCRRHPRLRSAAGRRSCGPVT